MEEEYQKPVKFKKNKKGYIKYIVGLIVILVVAFLSQQAYSRGFIKPIVSSATNEAGAYLSKGSDWAISNIVPKVTVEVQKRGDIIKNEVNQEKQKVSESITKKVEDYFSGVANAIAGKENTNNTNCPPAK